MTPDDFRATLEAAGVTQAWLARILSAAPSTPHRWAVGARDVPQSVAILLRALATGVLTPATLEALAQGGAP